MIAAALLDPLSSVDQPLFLVLDDYHLIHEPKIHDLMRLLIQRLPVDIYPVLITRIDPPLPLPRLRVRDQMVELRGKDLRFSDQEAICWATELGILKLPLHLHLRAAAI